jgi:energy-coupling factor transporter ATP-binding protein EcfA2
LSAVGNTEAIEGVNTDLDIHEPGEFDTILFTGHRGCGKSTELKRIQPQRENEYRVIYREFNWERDVNEAEYTDIYLLFIKKVADDLTELRLKFDPKLLDSFESWFKEVTQETEATVQSSVSSETLGRNLSRQTDINLLLKDAFDKLKRKYPDRYPKEFLVIVANLEGIPPSVGNHLFFEYPPQLQKLDCTIIYTVPISVIYLYKNVSNLFGNPNIVPMVNIYEVSRSEFDLNYNQQRWEGVTSLIEQRVEVSSAIFADRQQLLDLVKARGSHLRQLIQVTRSACHTAITRKHSKILAENVTYVLKQQQFDLKKSTPGSEYYTKLPEVGIEKEITKDERGQNLLFNLSLLEYNGNSRWNYVNPLVK